MNTVDTETPWRQGCAAALAGLKDMHPNRLAAALADTLPEVLWEQLGNGDLVPGSLLQASDAEATALRKQWRAAVRNTNPLDVLEQYQSKGVSVWTPTDDYPECLLLDPARPEVLFWRGSPQALAHPSVAIIGTRHCTPQGKDIARRFGAELAEAGVSVVSGLAIGIDGAAHQGALEVPYGAPPIGVVGSGLNRVYPQRHQHLWDTVGERGLLVSEAPLDAEPKPWRFPARNRIIAGMADVVLVVESHESGGSSLTVNEAVDRDVPVMAVPGSVRSPAARGSNALLREGHLPALDVGDVLVALQGLAHLDFVQSPHQEQLPLEPSIDPVDQQVLDAIGWEPSSTDDLLLRCDFSLGQVATALARLQQGGWVQNVDGWWHRR